MTVARRLVFGRSASQYHRFRPAYPDALINDLVALAGVDGSRAVVEVGAGTGKATAMLTARGVPVVAVEPSTEMASFVRGSAGVSVEIADFEDWDARGRRFPLVFSAQAWHWVRPSLAYAKAAAVLEAGGWLAAFWNRPDWARCALRPALLAAYESAAPDAERDGPMHPASAFSGREESWEAEVARVGELEAAAAREYTWSVSYTADDYAGLLATTSELQLMPDGPREALLAAVRSVVGAGFVLPMRTRLCLARRVA